MMMKVRATNGHRRVRKYLHKTAFNWLEKRDYVLDLFQHYMDLHEPSILVKGKITNYKLLPTGCYDDFIRFALPPPPPLAARLPPP